MIKFLQNTAILIFVYGFFGAVSVFAQLAGNPENFCRNGFFPRDSEKYSIAVVKGGRNERVYFYGDQREDCPGGKDCRLKSYVVPDDEVIVSRKFGEYACAWFQPRKGSETVGWIRLKNLEFPEMPGSTGAQAWVGEWRFYDSSIKIAAGKTKNVYQVTGNAFWKGLGDNIHVGELDGTAKLVETDLLYGTEDADEYACRVKMSLVGGYMIVSDNLNCGGVNVTFSGVYQKKAKK